MAAKKRVSKAPPTAGGVHKMPNGKMMSESEMKAMMGKKKAKKT